MLVTLRGIVIAIRFEQLVKALSSIIVTALGIEIVDKFLQPLNALFPMRVALRGIITEVIPIIPQKE